MSQGEQDWLVRTHWQAIEQHLQQQQRTLVHVEQMFVQAAEQQRQLAERTRRLLEQLHRQAIEQGPEQHPASPEPATIHYTELQDLPADSPIHEEWQTYRRELPRLLKEGLEGQFALVKGGEVVAVFATLAEGIQAGRQKYLLQPFLVQPIREREPLLRIRGLTLPCHSDVIRSPRMS